MKWIRVKETGKQPEGVIIGWVELSGGWTARCGIMTTERPFRFWQSRFNDALKVTHWMPLPDPPTVLEVSDGMD